MKKVFLNCMLLLCALIVGSGTMWGTEKTLVYSVTSKSAVTLQNTSTGSFSGTVTFANSGSNNNDQMTNGNTMTLTLASFPYKVTKVSLNLKRSSNNGAGTVSISHNGNPIGSGSKAKSDLTTSYTNYDFSCNDSQTEGNLVVLLTSSATSFWCNLFTITYDDAPAKTLSSISLSGTYPTSFTEKDDFSHTGMTVTANYDDNSTKDVTSSATFTGYNMNQVGNQTVTVSYTEGNITKTASYGITISEGTKYTVTFYPETGTCGTSSLTETEYKGGVTLPKATCNKSGWVFAGWAAASVANTSNRPTLYLYGETFYPTSVTNLYAVYTLEGVDGTKYMRATQLSDVTSATNLIVVNNSMAIDDALGSVSAPTETDGLITPSNNIVWSLSGNNTDGFTLTTTSLTTNKKLGITNIPSSSGNVLLTDDNSRWIIETHTGGDNLFVLKNKTNPSDNTKVGVLEYSSSKWKYYCVSSSTYKTTNTYSKSKLYIPVPTVYNSNPTADIIQPAVGFEKGNTTLYLDGTTTYSNAASVTNVDKSVTGYKSSDEDVATVAADGTVTAQGIGTATITAYLNAELGVHKAAQATYNVVVKNTTTVAGLKTITSSSTAVNFAADLTDAVVTYVEPTATSKYAYIQDASAAIMVYISGGHDLTAGQKINGAVSGQIKASYSIQQISSIDVSEATVTDDGIIPAAEEKTLAYIVANAASLDGKKVLVNDATVSTGMNNTTSGGVITDDGGTTTVNIIAPNKLTLKATEIGNFTGFVSTYVSGNTTYRLNLYEASQYQKTQNVETPQTLTFTNNAVELDEETSALTEFTGQTVSGAYTTVTYSKIDESSIIADFNTSTGALTLNGTCGTATITATAAAENVEEAGVTTPYTEATKSYTITVSPRYIVTFSINGVETTLRQATSGVSITVPTPADYGDYKFRGWSTSTFAPTNTKPSMADLGAAVTPMNNDSKYYAVYALATAGGEEEVTSTFTILRSSALSNPYEDNNVSWSHSGVTFNTSNSCGMPSGSTVTITLPENYVSTTSLSLTGAGATWAGTTKAYVNLKAGETQLKQFNKDNLSYDFTSNYRTFTLSSDGTNGCWISQIEVVYTVVGIIYSDYRITMPDFSLTTVDNDFYGLYLPWEVAIPDGIEAYTGDLNNEETALTITKIQDGYIPAATAVIVKSPSSTGTFTFTASAESVAPIAVNDLRGVAVSTPVEDIENDNTGKTCLTLGSNGTSVGFRKPAGTSIAANKVYLLVTTPQNGDAPSAIRIVEGENNATNIENLDATEEAVKFIQDGKLYIMRNGVVYDAVGRLIRK